MKKYTKKNIRNTKGAKKVVTKKPKLKLKKGDSVIVMTGKDKGKKGAILRVFPGEGRIIVEGVAVHKRHTRAIGNQSGRIIEKSLPINVSNVMLMDPKADKPTRVKRVITDGKRVRTAVKSGTTLA